MTFLMMIIRQTKNPPKNSPRCSSVCSEYGLSNLNPLGHNEEDGKRFLGTIVEILQQDIKKVQKENLLVGKVSAPPTELSEDATAKISLEHVPCRNRRNKNINHTDETLHFQVRNKYSLFNNL